MRSPPRGASGGALAAAWPDDQGQQAYAGRVAHITWENPEWHPTIDSTNLEAARDPRPGRVIVADHQSAGLGRRGRTWTAPPDTSVAISVVLPAPGPDRIGWVPLLTGLAVARAVEDSRYAVPVALKWPNDVLAREGDQWLKVCGVLAQGLPVTPAGPVVVVGAGVNIDQTRDQLPVETATSWRLARGGPDGKVTGPLPEGTREQFVTDYLSRLAHWMGALVTDPGTVRTAYAERCVTLGQVVRVHQPDGSQRVGLAVAVDDAGALVVEGDGRRTTHLAGDVVHVRRAG